MKKRIQLNYRVARHDFSLVFDDEDPLVLQLEAYRPFLKTSVSGRKTFSLQVIDDDVRPYGFEEETRQSEEGQEIVCGRLPDGHTAIVFLKDGLAGWLDCGEDYGENVLHTTGVSRKLAFDNSVMMCFALATARHDTLLFHASTVVWQGAAYLFLGVSGTGKSTHSRLWLEHIPDTWLLNDDNPVVRIDADGCIRVYGSPWSGKTPCYKNERMPVGAIVGLAQCPENRIRRLRPIEAYALLIGSISGKRWEKSIADGIHQTVERIVSRVALWHLDCLPDSDAARLCNTTVAPRVEASSQESPVMVMNKEISVVMEEVRRMTGSGMKVVLPVSGFSMRPFIRGGRDSVELYRLSGPLRIGDVVLAWADGTHYVLHRVVEMSGERLTLEGDGNVGLQEHCTVADVIARGEWVVNGRGERKSLISREAMQRWRWWLRLRFARRVLLKLYQIFV